MSEQSQTKPQTRPAIEERPDMGFEVRITGTTKTISSGELAASKPSSKPSSRMVF